MTKKDIFQLKPDILSSQIGEEIVLLDMASGKYYKIDEIGSTIWSLIKEPKTIDEIVDLILVDFDVDRATCVSDVSKFLEDIKSKDFLTA
jgi:hypothetical protein